MALSIKVNLENFPQGEEIAIEGVGRFVNGGDAIEIPIHAEEAFFIINNRPISEIADQEGYTVSGSPEYDPPVVIADENTNTQVIELPVSPTTGQETGLPTDTTDQSGGDE